MIVYQKSRWLAAINESKWIFSLWRRDALWCSLMFGWVRTVTTRSQDFHSLQFKGNLSQKQAKETMVWWKIPLVYSSWDKSQSKQHRSKVAHVCYSTEDRRKPPWNVINKKKKSLHLKNHVKSEMDVWISQWNCIGWPDVKMSSWAFVCFSTFLSISSGMVTRLTPSIRPGFFGLTFSH